MSEISDVVNKFEIEKAYYYGCKEDLEKAYQQGKLDGARDFAEWLNERKYFDGWYKFDGNEEVKLTTNEILAEWQNKTNK